MEIRSYRRVFDLERRVYSIDRLRLNPGGVPVRGLVYLLALLLLSVVISGVPMVGLAADLLPWWARDLALPVIGAGVLGGVRLDGRPFHVGALTRLRFFLRSRRRPCWPSDSSKRRWAPAPIVVLPDGSDGIFRRMQYVGPGAVRVSLGHSRETAVPESDLRAVTSARTLGRVTIRPLRDCSVRPRPQIIVLADGARLRVEPSVPMHPRR